MIMGSEKLLDENQALNQEQSKFRASRSKGEAVAAEKPATSRPRTLIIKPPKPVRNGGAVSRSPSPDRSLKTLNGYRRQANRSPSLALKAARRLDESPASSKEKIFGDQAGSPDRSLKTLNGFKQAQGSRQPLALKAPLHDDFPSVKENVAGDKTMHGHLRVLGNKPVSDTTCRVCWRVFKSIKSMHGHLRVHQRPWKGAKPPEEERLPSPPSSPSDDDHSTPSPHWPVTGEPRRRNGEASMSCDRVELDDQVVEAAEALLLLANSFMVEKNEDYGESRSESRLEDEDSSEEEGEISDQPMLGKDEDKKTKYLKVVYDSTPVKQEKTYSCSVCGKSFSSHQALGGHTASHKKGRSNAEEIERLEEIEETIGAAKSKHECQLCNLVFPTGQALGGHKRKHYEKGTICFKKAPHLSFNLNELPDADGDEV